MRNIFLEIRLTQDEKDKIRHDAGRCGMCVSTYVRQKALGGRPRTKDMTLTRNELSKFGGLLKHIHNEGFGYERETAELLSTINSAIRDIDWKGERHDRDSQNTEKT